MCLKKDAISCTVLEEGALQLIRDSRCRRFLKETAARKSDRNLISPFFAWLVQNRYHSLVSSILLFGEMIRMVFFCKFVHLFSLLFSPSDCELWFTINWIYEKSIVNTCKMSTLRVNFLAASLPRIAGHMVLILFSGFAMSSIMTASFLLSPSSG